MSLGPNAKGEAAGTHPEDEAELFTLASTRLLASLGHVYHPKSLKNDKYAQNRAQSKIEECIPSSSKKDEVLATPDEDSKHNGLILMIVRQKEKDTYTYTMCPQNHQPETFRRGSKCYCVTDDHKARCRDDDLPTDFLFCCFHKRLTI